MELFKSHRRYIDDMDEGDGIHDTKFDRGCQEIINEISYEMAPN